MNKALYRLPAALLAAFVIGVYLFLSVRPAAAAVSSWVRWKIDLTYPNDKPDAQLIIQKWHMTTSGQHILDDEKSFALSCHTVGSPTVHNGELSLDGNSYVTCDVPSIQEKAWQSWHMSIPDSCNSKRPYITGKFTIEGSPNDSTPDNPIFYRDDIQLDAPLDITLQQAALDMAFGQAAAESGAFTIKPAGHDFTAQFIRSGATYNPLFVVDGNTLSATPATITQPAILSTLESTIYLGYSPVSGEYFEGTIGPLEIDPVCIGTG